MNNMFLNCEKLEQININFDTKLVKDFSSMFKGCNALQSLSLNNFDITSAENLSNMFNGCKSLLNLDLNNFKSNKVYDMSYMFYGCEKLEIITNLNLDTTIL